MTGDAEATRRRLLDAAAVEFAERGVAGARVDRIAAAARSNKAQIYHYFTNKDGLFDAVMREQALAALREAPAGDVDLPEYAGRLFDRVTDDPVVARLASWYRLEGGGGRSVEAAVAGLHDRLAAVAAARDAGFPGARFSPVELLALVEHLSRLWASSAPELAALADRIPRARRRQVVVDAVAALLSD